MFRVHKRYSVEQYLNISYKYLLILAQLHSGSTKNMPYVWSI